jgi:HK97 family phage major capsid protein
MKDRRANEFRAQADAIMAELSDASKSFSKEEIEQKSSAVQSLLSRAQAVAGYTPEAEIESQGGDSLVRAMATPEAKEPESRSIAEEKQDLIARVAKDFGGPNGFIKSLARRSVEPLSSRQAATLNAVQAFKQRTITGEDTNASNAEVLLPLQQEASIFSAPMTVAGMFDSARRYTVNGRTLRIPYLVQTDGDVTRPMSSIANVTIVGEAAEKPLREPKFDQRILTVFKYAAYTEFSDEMLADDFTGDLAPTVQASIGGTIINKINEDITFDGTGSSQPLGAFNNSNGALYKVTRKTQNDFKVEDVFNMYARHVIGPNSRWYIHPSVVPKMMSLTLNGTTLVTFIQSLTNTPQMQLLGIPVVVTPLVALLGSQGDVCLGNGAFYAMALRQALTVESSIHYKFRNDVTAYRFFARAGGIPIPTSTYSYKSVASVKEFEVSPFVVLDDVYAS